MCSSSSLFIIGKWTKWVLIKYIWNPVPERLVRRLCVQEQGLHFQDWVSAHHFSVPQTVLVTLIQTVRCVSLMALGRVWGFTIRSNLIDLITKLRLPPFSESHHKRCLWFHEALLCVENSPWENKSIVVSCSVFVCIVFFVFFFFLLLSSFNINDKKKS